MEEPQGTQSPQAPPMPERHRVRVRKKRRRQDPDYNRGISALFHSLGFLMVSMLGITIPWIYYAYQPGPLETRFGLVGYFLYFTLWLAIVIYLAGSAIFGREREWWQLAAFVGIGILLGFAGGWFFARSFGEWVGLITGILVSPLVFFARWWLLGLDL